MYKGILQKSGYSLMPGRSLRFLPFPVWSVFYYDKSLKNDKWLIDTGSLSLMIVLKLYENSMQIAA